MRGLAATFWSALGGICQVFSSVALSRSIWWSSRASEFYEKARSSLARRGQGRAPR